MKNLEKVTRHNVILFCVFVCLCSSQLLNAEMYPIGAKWYFDSEARVPYRLRQYTLYEVVKDTVVLNLQSKLIVSTFFGINGLIAPNGKFILREESKKVYRLDKDRFILMYDFNLKKGDTLAVKIQQEAKDSLVSPIVVDSISTIKIDGLEMKVQFLSWSLHEVGGYYFRDRIKLIENVGDLYGFVFKPTTYLGESYTATSLRCCIKPDFSYRNWFAEYACDSVVNEVGFASHKIKQISVYRNFSEQGLYKVQSEEEIEFISISDIQGRVLQQVRPYDHSLSISLAAQPKGVYVFRVVTARGNYFQKVISQ